MFDQLGLDKLQLSGLGVQVGKIQASDVLPANVYAITADYGQIAPRWRILFSVSYWESRLNDQVVQTFLDTLRNSVVDPTHDYQLALSRVRVYDVAFGGTLRWMPASSAAFQPFLEGGLAAHVINAEGKLIQGTFVESALDQIAPGFSGGAGIQFRAARLSLEGLARGELLSGFRSVQLRVGASYYFGPSKVATP